MRLGQIVKYRGDTVKVVSLNDDGTLTLAHVSSSGKKGFAGKIAAPKTFNGISPEPLSVYKTATGEMATVSLEQYNSYTEPINNAAISQLDGLRFKYFSAATKGENSQLNEILTNMRAVSNIVDANFQDVIEGRCGIEDCQYQHRGGMAPSHYPSTGCQSGQVPHCTCDACF